MAVLTEGARGGGDGAELPPRDLKPLTVLEPAMTPCNLLWPDLRNNRWASDKTGRL